MLNQLFYLFNSTVTEVLILNRTCSKYLYQMSHTCVSVYIWLTEVIARCQKHASPDIMRDVDYCKYNKYSDVLEDFINIK